jgi:hypothetical protein
MTRHINEQRGLVVPSKGQVQNRSGSSGSDVYTVALGKELGVLAAVQTNKKKLYGETKEWTASIVTMAMRTVHDRPGLWDAAMKLCVALDGFWNTKFAHTASKAGIAVKNNKKASFPYLLTYVQDPLVKGPGWMAPVTKKIPNARELHDSYNGLQGPDQGNAIWDPRYDNENRAVPDYLQYFAGRMADLERFRNAYCDQYNEFEGVIGKKDKDIDVLLDNQTRGDYGDFGLKARTEVIFIRKYRQDLKSARAGVDRDIAEVVKLYPGNTTDMSELTGHVPWSTGLPPNTPTLVAMQRLLMRLSDGVT